MTSFRRLKTLRGVFFKFAAICFLCVIIVLYWTEARMAYETVVKVTIYQSLNTTQSGDNHTSTVVITNRTSTLPRALFPINTGHVPDAQNLEEQWTETTEIEITERRFVASENNRVFILGVVAKNSTRSTKWDKFAVYGQWYNRNVDTSSLRCCFKYDNGTIAEQYPTDFNVRNYRHYVLQAQLLLWHVTCDHPPPAPRWVSIARHYSCDSGNVTFIKPYFAMKKPDGHIVITTKMAYGHINPETVVGFLETARYFGVGKVITYVYSNLSPRVQKVLRYYAYIGILDYYTIELAESERVQRSFPPGASSQYLSDEWMLKRDALERSMGSTYFGIFDMDEYLIPSQNRSYQELLRDLGIAFPKASHFFFPNVHYLVDVDFEDPVCTPNCSMFRRHIMTSPQRFNNIHEKMFLMTSRVVADTIHNHGVTSMSGFTRVDCPNTSAYIRHYGSCRRKFSNALCANRRRWVKDTSMVEWAERTVNDIIQKARKRLNC